MYNPPLGDTFITFSIKPLFGTMFPNVRRFVLQTLVRGMGLVIQGGWFIRILTEASEKSRNFAVEVLEEIKSSLPGRDLFDVEWPAPDAETIWADLRQEKPVIVQWLPEGHYHALLKHREPQGRT